MAAKFEHIFHVLTKNFLSQCGMPELRLCHMSAFKKHLYAPIGLNEYFVKSHLFNIFSRLLITGFSNWNGYLRMTLYK